MLYSTRTFIRSSMFNSTGFAYITLVQLQVCTAVNRFPCPNRCPSLNLTLVIGHILPPGRLNVWVALLHSVWQPVSTRLRRQQAVMWCRLCLFTLRCWVWSVYTCLTVLVRFPWHTGGSMNLVILKLLFGVFLSSLW